MEGGFDAEEALSGIAAVQGTSSFEGLPCLPKRKLTPADSTRKPSRRPTTTPPRPTSCATSDRRGAKPRRGARRFQSRARHRLSPWARASLAKRAERPVRPDPRYLSHPPSC